jgi:hypothetical protein
MKGIGRPSGWLAASNEKKSVLPLRGLNRKTIGEKRLKRRGVSHRDGVLLVEFGISVKLRGRMRDFSDEAQPWVAPTPA